MARCRRLLTSLKALCLTLVVLSSVVKHIDMPKTKGALAKLQLRNKRAAEKRYRGELSVSEDEADEKRTSLCHVACDDVKAWQCKAMHSVLLRLAAVSRMTMSSPIRRDMSNAFITYIMLRSVGLVRAWQPSDAGQADGEESPVLFAPPVLPTPDLNRFASAPQAHSPQPATPEAGSAVPDEAYVATPSLAAQHAACESLSAVSVTASTPSMESMQPLRSMTELPRGHIWFLYPRDNAQGALAPAQDVPSPYTPQPPPPSPEAGDATPTPAAPYRTTADDAWDALFKAWTSLVGFARMKKHRRFCLKHPLARFGLQHRQVKFRPYSNLTKHAKQAALNALAPLLLSKTVPVGEPRREAGDANSLDFAFLRHTIALLTPAQVSKLIAEVRELHARNNAIL